MRVSKKNFRGFNGGSILNLYYLYFQWRRTNGVNMRTENTKQDDSGDIQVP